MSARVHRYGRHRSQVAELTLPDGSGPHPVVVLIHGGCWRARYDRHLMDELAADLAARGWAAWNVEYRRVGPRAGGGWPATFDDVAAAIDHLAEVDAPLDLGASPRSATRRAGTWRSGAAGRTDARVPLTAVVGQAAVSDLDRAAAARACAAAWSSSCWAALPRACPIATARRRRHGGSRSGSRCCSCTAAATTPCPPR